MNHLPKPTRPVVFMTIIFIVLISSSFFADSLWPATGSRNNFISDITVKKEKPSIVKAKRHSSAIIEKADSGKIVIPVRDYLTYDGIVSYETERRFALTNFITALKQLKTGQRKKVRIAYFGDSMIEGDLISEDLRRQFQDSFGGTGVGFVPVTSVVSGFRQTILHSHSSNWTDKSYMTMPMPANLFLSGHSFTSDSTSTAQYGVVNLPHLQQFAQAHVLYGKGQNPLQLTVNGKAFTLPAAASCNKALVATACQAIKVKASNATPVFGFSFEDTAGIYIDNFAFRGSTGIELANFTAAFLKQVQQVHDYDLIIFQYGPNLFTPKVADFTWYQKPLLTSVLKFKTAYPAASLLIVSTADKAYRYNGEWETAVGVEPLLEAQNNVADSAAINLWNLYQAMGGRNSMLGWVEGDTPLARKDYTHFTNKGAQKVASLLFTSIMKEYALAR